MAQTQNFRTAFNGFNREDVVQYLSILNTKHAAEISQLKGEAEELRRELEAAEDCEALREKIAAMEAELAQANAEKAELEQKAASLEAELAAVREEAAKKPAFQNMTGLMPEPAASVRSTNEELEAYRRAERAERVARERAASVYSRASGILTDATGKVDGAAGQLSTMAEQALQQLQQLQKAVMNSRYSLQEAVADLYALRPELEEEK